MQLKILKCYFVDIININKSFIAEFNKINGPRDANYGPDKLTKNFKDITTMHVSWK